MRKTLLGLVCASAILVLGGCNDSASSPPKAGTASSAGNTDVPAPPQLPAK